MHIRGRETSSESDYGVVISQDELVNVSYAYKLYDRAQETKQIIITNEVGHGLRQNDRLITIVVDWFKYHTQIN